MTKNTASDCRLSLGTSKALALLEDVILGGKITLETFFTGKDPIVAQVKLRLTHKC